MNYLVPLILLATLGFSGCASNNVVSAEEVAMQNKADAVVAGALFEKELDDRASYNIRKNGSVVIKFDGTVPEATYTSVVNELRASADIKSVLAEQGGVEVCPLKPY